MQCHLQLYYSLVCLPRILFPDKLNDHDRDTTEEKFRKFDLNLIRQPMRVEIETTKDLRDGAGWTIWSSETVNHRRRFFN